MKIIRADLKDRDLFSEEELSFGACCFYSEDRLFRYIFKITGTEAVLYANEYSHLDRVIDEFLFYSGFISIVKNSDGNVLRSREPTVFTRFPIDSIQPSQFYINEKKLANCMEWIREEKDVQVPVAEIRGMTVSLDGHTRLRAALNKGYEFVYVYPEDSGDYIDYFVDCAANRNIRRVSDMELVGDDEYREKWHKFCDDFFNTVS